MYWFLQDSINQEQIPNYNALWEQALTSFSMP